VLALSNYFLIFQFQVVENMDRNQREKRDMNLDSWTKHEKNNEEQILLTNKKKTFLKFNMYPLHQNYNVCIDI
jgi:hypothetical protein